MPNEESLYRERFKGYKFKLEDESRNIYSFQTRTGDLYNVIFRSSPYVFGEDAIFARYVYELIIELAGNELVSKGTDMLLPYTVYNIFLDFFIRNGEQNICLYICDSSDGRQLARARKFVYWFRLLNDTGIIYTGDEIKDSDGTVYPVAVLMKRTNPYRFQIIEAFDNLVTTYNK